MIDKLDGPEAWLMIVCLMLATLWLVTELREILAMRCRKRRREAYARYCEMIDATSNQHGRR